MAAMTAEETWDFLMEGTRTGHLATVRADGRPHVKPVWFELTGEPGDFQLVFTTAADTVAGRNLRRDGRVAISVDDPVPPFAFVLIEGHAGWARIRLSCWRRPPRWAAGTWALGAPPNMGPATLSPANSSSG